MSIDMKEVVRIVKCSHWKCITNDYVSLMSKWQVGFSCTEPQLISFCPPRVALSDSAGESDIRPVSEKICQYKV